MTTAIAINGSPRMGKGDTAVLLRAFLQGMTDAGCDVDLLYASSLDVRPCVCGVMHCWDVAPGECCIHDQMQDLYATLHNADVLVLATPVYVPLPGPMQDILNRLCPLIDPVLEFRQGRTRARRRSGVRLRSLVLVSTCGWWERENFGTVARIVAELADDMGVEFAGAVLRPHAFLMREGEEVTPDGRAVLDAAHRAGGELIEAGSMSPATLERVAHPLISREEYWRLYAKSS